MPNRIVCVPRITQMDLVVANLDDANVSLLLNDCLACAGDLDHSGRVNTADLALLLGAWGPNPGHVADLNADDVVNAADLALLLAAWGDCFSQ